MIVLLVAAAACSPAARHLTRADLQHDPADQLVPAGAEPLWVHQGDEYHMTIDGPYFAEDISLYRTHGDADSVVSFYNEQLERLGWRSPYRAFLTTAETDARSWCKGKMVVRLGIRDPQEPMNARYFEDGYPTAFEILVGERDTAIACPFRLSR